MPICYFERGALVSVPWKNGGGLTRQIVSRPDGAGLDAIEWRVSIARVDADGPFSTFPGIDRVIVLLDGMGLRLRSPAGTIDHLLDVPLAPFAFDGEAEIASTLLSGGSSDFNVMTRRATLRAEVDVLRAPHDLPACARGVLFAARGSWQVQGAREDAHPPMDAARVLSTDSGVWWDDAPMAWRLSPSTPDAALIAVRVVAHVAGRITMEER